MDTYLKILKENINRSKVNIFPDTQSEINDYMSLSLRVRPNTVKSRLRRFLQSVYGAEKRITKTRLKTNIGTHAKRFKNKTIIEVSNPQTDYKFLTRI